MLLSSSSLVHRKKISDVDFVKKVLPDVAAFKCKAKSPDDPKAQEELAKMKKKLVGKLEEMKSDTGVGCLVCSSL